MIYPPTQQKSEGGKFLILGSTSGAILIAGNTIDFLGKIFRYEGLVNGRYVFSNGIEGPGKITMFGEVLAEDAQKAVLRLEQAGEEILAIVRKDVAKLLQLKLGTQGFQILDQWIQANKNTLTFASKTGDEAVMALLEELELSLGGKNVNLTKIDNHGRVLFQSENKVFSLQNLDSSHPEFATKTVDIGVFSRPYNPINNPEGVPLSENLLALDYSINPNKKWLYDITGTAKQNTIKIKMQGGRSRDFLKASKDAGFGRIEKVYDINGIEYTWHHLDDFNPLTGECTMQLVKTLYHRGIQHTGAVKQFEIFFGILYKTY